MASLTPAILHSIERQTPASEVDGREGMIWWTWGLTNGVQTWGYCWLGVSEPVPTRNKLSNQVGGGLPCPPPSSLCSLTVVIPNYPMLPLPQQPYTSSVTTSSPLLPPVLQVELVDEGSSITNDYKVMSRSWSQASIWRFYRYSIRGSRKNSL